MDYAFLDSLKYDWASALPRGCGEKRVYLNPPYGCDAGKFFQQRCLESRKGIEVICLLVPLTGSGWLHSELQLL